MVTSSPGSVRIDADQTSAVADVSDQQELLEGKEGDRRL